MALPTSYEAGSAYVALLEVGGATTLDSTLTVTGLATMSGGMVRATKTVTANYSILTTDDTVLMNSGTAKTLTLPDVATVAAGRRYTLLNIGAGAVTVKSAGGTINGVAAATGDTTSLASQYGHAGYMSDGAQWLIA